MQYRARQEMLFMLNGKQNTTTAIERGTMLEAVELSSLSAREREPFVGSELSSAVLSVAWSRASSTSRSRSRSRSG